MAQRGWLPLQDTGCSPENPRQTAPGAGDFQNLPEME